MEEAAQALAYGKWNPVDMEKAMPHLEAAAKKNWGLPRINTSIKKALQAAKRPR